MIVKGRKLFWGGKMWKQHETTHIYLLTPYNISIYMFKNDISKLKYPFKLFTRLKANSGSPKNLR